MTNKLALVVAVVLGVLSILGVRFYVEKIKKAYDDKNTPVDVPVATRDLRAGDTVQSGDVTLTQVPRIVLDSLGSTHYIATETDKFIGLKVVVPTIKQGQVFQTYHFRAQTVKQRMQIPSDCRAVTVAVGTVNGLAGMLRPGDKVDVVVTEQFKDQSNGAGGAGPGHKDLKVTTTLLQKVEILAVDGYTDPETSIGDYSSVTLKLKPDEVNRLVHAIDTGSTYHLVKMDDTASQSSTSNPVFADEEFERVWPEVKAFYDHRAKQQFESRQPPSGPPR